jgi:hypothetical protein
MRSCPAADERQIDLGEAPSRAQQWLISQVVERTAHAVCVAEPLTVPPVAEARAGARKYLTLTRYVTTWDKTNVLGTTHDFLEQKP